jgi:outer membrane protein OmpA-like peptidoglycan-associated protein
MKKVLLLSLLMLFAFGCHKKVIKEPVVEGQSFSIYYLSKSPMIEGAGFGDLIDAIDFIRSNNFKYIVEGHADDFDNEKMDRELAEQRARAVVSYLIGYGFDPARFELDFIVDEEDSDNPGKNKRVEFKVVK